MKKLETYTHIPNSWIAGVIDGDGYFYISKAGLAQFELTTGVEDERMLLNLKTEIGGRITSRAGARAIRLRIHKQELMCNLLHRVNGHIRNPKRWYQFIKVCAHFGIIPQKAPALTRHCCYIAGLFDSDGSISITVNKSSAEHSILPGVAGKITRLAQSGSHNQLNVKITSKFKDELLAIQQALNFGNVITQTANPSVRHPHAVHVWYFRSIAHCQNWAEYTTKCGLRSSKQKRFRLLAKYFELKEKKYHLYPDTAQGVLWQKFCKQWFLL